MYRQGARRRTPARRSMRSLKRLFAGGGEIRVPAQGIPRSRDLLLSSVLTSGHLAPGERGEQPTPLDQLTVGAALDQAPALQDVDLIGVDNRAEAVRDHDPGRCQP